MTKKLYIAIIIVVVVFAGWWWYNKNRVQENPYGADDINKDLQQLEVNNLDGEIQKIDQEMNNL